MFLMPASRARPGLQRQRDQLGYQLSATVTTGNALVITLSPVPGNNPFLEFRDPTLVNGDPVFRAIPNGAQFIISSTNTMGAANNTPLRLWVFGVDNGSGITLGAINCVTGGASPTAIAPLDEAALLTTTGGNGGSSAATFYAALTLTSRPFRLLGYLEWSAGLATAGTWNIKPTKIQLYGYGIKKPGDTVQIVSASTITSTTTSSSSFVDTNLSAAITPTSAVNLIHAMAMADGLQTVAAGGIQATLARGATAIGNINYVQTNTNAVTVGPLCNLALDNPGVTTATTYKVRVRSPNAASVTYIQVGAYMTVQEVMS